MEILPCRNIPASLSRLIAFLFLVTVAACRPSYAPPGASAAGSASALGCRWEEPAAAPGLTTWVLVDQTTELQTDEIHQLVGELSADLRRKGGRVHVLAFGGRDPALLRKVFDDMFPDASGAQDAMWSSTPAQRKAAAACLEARRSAMDVALTRALQATDLRSAGYSPIMEAVRAALGRLEQRQGLQRLILISDAIEHAGSSFYEPRTDRLRLPPPARAVSELRALDALPDARQVFVWHVAFGSSGRPAGNAQRTLRPPAETAALRRVYDALWTESGAVSWVYGEPMPPLGFGAPQQRN